MGCLLALACAVNSVACLVLVLVLAFIYACSPDEDTAWKNMLWFLKTLFRA